MRKPSKKAGFDDGPLVELATVYTRATGLPAFDTDAWVIPGFAVWLARQAMERCKLLEMTRSLAEHPEGYGGPCNCRACGTMGRNETT
jgi:hypothetical protein